MGNNDTNQAVQQAKFDKEGEWREEIEDTPKESSGELKPESEVFTISPIKHKHYFIRTSATEFGCRDCFNRWIDGGAFIFENGKFVGVRDKVGNK